MVISKCRRHDNCFTCPFPDCVYGEPKRTRKKEKNPKGGRYNTRKILAFNLQGKIIAIYDSIVNVGKDIGVKPNTVGFNMRKYGYYMHDNVKYIPADLLKEAADL